MQLTGGAPTPVEATLAAVPALTGPTGVIRSMGWRQPGWGDPALVHCHAVVQPPGPRSAMPVVAGGTSASGEVALAKAVGEAVERYCASLYDRLPLTVATARQLGDKAADPRRFALFHKLQTESPSFPYARVSGESRLSWVEGYSIPRDEPVWIPATMVHPPLSPLTAGDRFDECPVSGYACGNTLEEAILRGLYEVVERDAFMIWWYHWLRAPGIDLTSLSAPSTLETLGRYGNSPVRLFCSSITTDVGIPVALVGLTSWRPGWPATTIAMGADSTMEGAVDHALCELAANLLLVSSHLGDPGARRPRSPQQVVRMEDHGLFYATADLLPAMDPLLRPSRWMKSAAFGQPDPDADVRSEIERCVRLLGDCNLEVFAVDLTAPEVGEHGFKVVKVLVPGMRPIDFGVQWPHLGGERLYEAPVRMGYPSTARDPSGLNLFPHPFP